ncbi:hypothetical protein GHT09_008204 [Marmota monax]|uniref:Uncharacterized protein n=1 Tax=Marmota monax TaxID=9995 RepID=A0A834PQZ2_MARMO|nr:hypothetical protein GHT09_008204 [Marmota monax]
MCSPPSLSKEARLRAQEPPKQGVNYHSYRMLPCIMENHAISHNALRRPNTIRALHSEYFTAPALSSLRQGVHPAGHGWGRTSHTIVSCPFPASRPGTSQVAQRSRAGSSILRGTFEHVIDSSVEHLQHPSAAVITVQPGVLIDSDAG